MTFGEVIFDKVIDPQKFDDSNLSWEKTSERSNVREDWSSFEDINDENGDGHHKWHAEPNHQVDKEPDAVFLIHVLGCRKDKSPKEKKCFTRSSI